MMISSPLDLPLSPANGTSTATSVVSDGQEKVGFTQDAMQDSGGTKHGEREDREEDWRRDREDEEGRDGEGRLRRAALAEKDYAEDNEGNGGVEESTSEVAERQEAVGSEEGGKEGEVEGAGEGPPVREEENDGTFVHLSNLRLN
ncbi:hypothetical protein NGA_0502400, partial [Nannochloropsis gaditana CCMP526]